MFMIDTPKTFKVGDTIGCRINGEPARITWRDDDTLVIEPGDARCILRTRSEGNKRVFICGHEGTGKDRYTVEKQSGGAVVSAHLTGEDIARLQGI